MRHRRLRQVAGAVRSAANLQSAAVQAARTFGLQVWGLPPTKRARMRAEAAAAASTAGKVRCTSTVLWLKYGRKEPGFQVLAELIKEWFIYWRNHPAAHQADRLAWMHLWLKLKDISASRRWHYCTGPMSAVIIMLLELQWRAPAPDTWLDHEGATWQLGQEGALCMRPLLGKLWEAHQVVTMARPASTFHCGQGMQGGVDMTVIHGFLRRLRRQGKFKEAGMLECAVSGATWPQARRQQEGYCDSGLMPP